MNRFPSMSGKQEEDAKQPRIQRSNNIRFGLTSSIRATSPRPASHNPGQKQVPTNNTTTSVSERATNRANNRVPLHSRFQRPLSGAKTELPVTELPRERILLNSRRSKTQQLAARQSRNEITKPKLLGSECTEQEEQRPRSSVQVDTDEHQEYDKTCSQPSLSSHKIMVAVKDVLSRAVIEKGKIDEENLGNILQHMKSRIFGEGSVDVDDRSDNIYIEGKQSMTSINTKASAEILPPRKSKPLAGIVRKHITDNCGKSSSKTYNKVYTQNELPNEHTIKKPHSRDANTIMYIDLPDSDYSNFTSIVRNDKERLKRSQYKKDNVKTNFESNNESIDSKTSQRDLSLGDCYMRERDQSFEFWKAAEDAKLHSYIESLIKNMNDQLCGKQPLQGFEDEFETKNTFCKSFCVCKVCVSKKPSKDDMKNESAEDQGMNKEINVKPNLARPNSNRPKQSQIVEERSSTHSNFRVLKRNKNFQPESKMNINPRHIMSGTLRDDNKDESLHKESYTVVEPGQTNEISDDMYLQRRFRSPIRKKGL